MAPPTRRDRTSTDGATFSSEVWKVATGSWSFFFSARMSKAPKGSGPRHPGVGQSPRRMRLRRVRPGQGTTPRRPKSRRLKPGPAFVAFHRAEAGVASGPGGSGARPAKTAAKPEHRTSAAPYSPERRHAAPATRRPSPRVELAAPSPKAPCPAMPSRCSASVSPLTGPQDGASVALMRLDAGRSGVCAALDLGPLSA